MPKGKKGKKKVKKTNRAGQGSYFRNHRSQFIIGGMITFLVAVLAAAYIYIIRNYTVTTVYVEGSVHYTNEEIIEMVMEGRYGSNSLLLAARYKDKSIVGVPFVEKMDVSVLDPHTIRIEVYEKALAGYVEYLERYMYFDKDGIIVESSMEKTPGIPQVTGLSFDHVILHEPLPVDDPGVFKAILTITQLVNKYNLSADRIYFGSDESLTLYFGDVRVALGNWDNLDEKIMRLQYMLPELTGKKGVLHMENYTEDTKNIPFEQDKTPQE
ncbi:MAG: cell division protein FtsQ/DivIB [Lachnospiraceae bacterium]|nr:cell division protein FtsQ/DivIB [Lachnospiraceae bacterium]